MKYLPINNQLFIKNRKNFTAQMKSNSLAVFNSNDIYPISADSTMPFHWRLEGVTLYCTLEPCAMCAGAMVLARLPRLVYAATDPKAGAGGSVMNVLDHEALNHRVEVTQGLLADEAAEQIRAFFRQLRAEGQK
jgi:tRNA(Arg) A34 adenosine deaminase TadA